jgi:hypothetical protein
MAADEPNVRATAGQADARARFVEVFRWLLVAVLLLDLIAGLITLPHASSLADLQRELRAGHVRSLTFVDGNSLRAMQLVRGGLAVSDNGEMVVWRTGTVSYKSAPMDLGTDFGTPAGNDDTSAALRKRIVAVADEAHVPVRSNSDQELLGHWRLTVILVYLILLVTLIQGRQPRRATKWATFWLFLLPLNAGMFLTLLREAPWSRRAREMPEPLPHKLQRVNGEARTTGGHAFMFTLVAGAVVQALAKLVARL